MKTIMMLTVFALATTLCTARAFGQADTLKEDYFANANMAGAPDGTLRLSNPGTYIYGNICASIFVFDPNQELSECCSCLLTPDGLRTLSVDTDITGNPLTGVTLTEGKIAIVSTVPVSGTCPLPTAVYPAVAIRSWGAHIQDAGFTVTETPSQDATLSPVEVTRLGNQCLAVRVVGSGHGICTCGTGD